MDAAIEKLRADGADADVIATFADQRRRLAAGETGTLPESAIEPVAALPDAESLPTPPPHELRTLLARTVMIKLNGGLGTSMGMERAKSLLEVKDGRSFLDLIARQVLALRAASGAEVPLLLMNSFATRADSLAALAAYPELDVGLPPDFVQSRVPKLEASSLEPVSWPAQPELEWAPPGHGDLYPSLRGSGALELLRSRGYRYAFVSNSDNLGATLAPALLAFFASSGTPFLMEVCDRTESDRKGGHLARRHGGGLVLREVAQCPEEDLDAFQDIGRHRYFNTNTLWVDLDVLARVMDERGGVLGLPMIVNRKTVDPTDASSPAVIQLETAMGAAIDVFDGAAAVRVPRARFAPVKTTADLLVLRSDAYRVASDGAVVLADGRTTAPLVQLSPAYRLVRDFEARFPAGPPSLVEATRLVVEGDVTFGAGVVVRGAVTVSGTERVPDGAVLEG